MIQRKPKPKSQLPLIPWNKHATRPFRRSGSSWQGGRRSRTGGLGWGSGGSGSPKSGSPTSGLGFGLVLTQPPSPPLEPTTPPSSTSEAHPPALTFPTSSYRTWTTSFSTFHLLQFAKELLRWVPEWTPPPTELLSDNQNPFPRSPIWTSFRSRKARMKIVEWGSLFDRLVHIFFMFYQLSPCSPKRGWGWWNTEERISNLGLGWGGN